MAEVEEICEVCDWKTQFGPEEIVNLIARIIEKNPDLITNKSADLEDVCPNCGNKTLLGYYCYTCAGS
jgi:hypothetical protein